MAIRHRPKLTRAELEIMQVIWQRRAATVNEVVERINAGRTRPLKRSTIQVQMQRLEDKGWLRHREAQRGYVYFTKYPRQQVSADILQDVTRRVFNGSSSQLLACMFENRMLSPAELRKLKAIIAEAEGGAENADA